jgi:hypothetical protein
MRIGDDMTETINEVKSRLYPERKKDAQQCVECYRDRLLKMADNVEDDDQQEVTIPVDMAYALVNVCNFVERLDSYGK